MCLTGQNRGKLLAVPASAKNTSRNSSRKPPTMYTYHTYSCLVCTYNIYSLHTCGVPCVRARLSVCASVWRFVWVCVRVCVCVHIKSANSSRKTLEPECLERRLYFTRRTTAMCVLEDSAVCRVTFTFIDFCFIFFSGVYDWNRVFFSRSLRTAYKTHFYTENRGRRTEPQFHRVPFDFPLRHRRALSEIRPHWSYRRDLWPILST